ncbi:penicillin-binding protein 2 [candidate division TM6 bacterium RIFCSPHIGHO2_12_FULL_36_22]|nr:MAG: penicillin-binding protein 2 [candidate division TM6 bacterium RIFCSPHIGHO2_12_FULL_36_22]
MVLQKPYALIFFFLFTCFGVVGRLWYLQIFLNEKLEQLSQKNFTRFDNILVPRGNITDIHGNLLATNRPVTHIYWCGTGKRTLSDEQLQKLDFLSEMLDTEISLEKIQIAEKHKKNFLIAQDIPFALLTKIAEQYSPNIQILTEFERYYPHQMLACHIVGYLGTNNFDVKIGKMGLERFFQQELVGKSGIIKKTVNAVGSNIHQREIKPITPGQSIKTTLDIPLQKIAESLFPPNYAGSFILMDSQTGALRALISRPTFNPSIFLKPITHDVWQELSDKKPFINRAYNACYPPASLFKLVTLVAGLEEGAITTNSTCYCRGYLTFGNRKYRCNNYYGHGEVTVKESIAQSCNIIFYKIGKKITINKLAEYAHRFGLGEPTGFALPEQSGFIPTAEWKMLQKNERWWPGETISATIGQTFMLVTPLQIARMISGIFEGYLVNPRILDTEPVIKSPLNIKPEHLALLKDSMKQVTEHGTALQLRKISNINIYAKTGTAQTSSLSNRNLGGKHIEHAWFVAHFSYKNQKPLTIVIFLEHAGYVRIATNMVKQFLIQYKSHIDRYF